MCGITGYIASTKMNAEAMTGSLRHRGPDHTGHYQTIFNDREIFLGHTRLSILDLSEQGHQPMYSADKAICLVFNGEVYNFKDLKKKYFSGEPFSSQTDTEVILKLYEKKGIGFIQELEGDFAIAILDQRMGKLFLIRDRVGVKPLYYFSDQGTFIFASEIKGIWATGVRPVLNEDEILNYFVFKYTPGNNTLFKNVFRLPPASYLAYDLATGSHQVFRYWELSKQNTYSDLSYAQAKDRLFDLVEQSVKQQLISDVPVGNFLSGGLDSSILAWFIKERKDITHYCARKSEADLKKEGTTSDHYYASKLATEWGLKLVTADIGKDNADPEMIRKTLYFSDDLIADGSQIPSYLITQKASKTSKVILSGMGADELFLGYAGHMLTLISSQWLSKIPFSNMLGNRAATIDQGKGKFLAYRRYLHKLGKYQSLPGYKFALFNIVGDFDNSCSVFKGNREKTIHQLTSYFPENTPVFDSLTRFETENFLVKNLHYTDRMAMANSVECRVPFLDHRIIEFAYSIPLNYKLTASGKFKRILKDTFRGKVPSYILKRRKAGFGMPLRSIFSDSENVNRLLDRAFFANFHSFSVEDIDRIVENHITGKEDNSSIIYALISFQEWYKLNFG